jgi:cellulose biosynthesis protein BcsQ
MLFNGKGGVGKSSIAANLGGIVAEAGWRVLLVDLDKQGNLARDLGVMELSDDGERLLRAAVSGVPIAPLKDVRPRLDFIPGGRKLREAVDVLPKDDPTWLDRALQPLAADYDLVIIDSPPGIWQLHAAGASVAGYVLIPTKVDDGSIDGLAEVIDEVIATRQQHNPGLEILGVVLTLVNTRYTRVIGQARQRLTDLLGDAGITIYDPIIRDTTVAGIEGTRNRGRLAHEYEKVAASAAPWWKRLRKEADESDEPVSKAAGGLSQDYQDLADAVIGDFLERQKRRSEVTTNG